MNKPPSPVRNNVYWRIAIPVALAAFGIFLLVGCIYLPIPEHHVGPEKDFRDLVGPPGSKNPIRAGAITKHQVMAILGPPTYASDDNKALGYVMRTDEGFAVWPLCFTAGADVSRIYAIRLVFENEILVSYEVVHDGGTSAYFGPRAPLPSTLIDQLNDHGPKLFEVGKPRESSTQPTTLPG